MITIQPTTCGDTNQPPPEKEFKRLVIPKADLLKALRENNLEGELRKVLQPDYGNLETFHLIIADFTRNIMRAVALALAKQVDPYTGLAMLFEPEKLQQLENQYLGGVRVEPKYWVGEGKK